MLTSSRLELLYINLLHSYSPSLMSEFHFHSILWEQIDGICAHFALILTRSRFRLLKRQFSQIYYRVMALDWCRNFIYAQYILRKNWWNLTKFCILGRSRMGFLHVYFYKFVTELRPKVWLISEFRFCSISWEILDRFWPKLAYALMLTTSRAQIIKIFDTQYLDKFEFWHITFILFWGYATTTFHLNLQCLRLHAKI